MEAQHPRPWLEKIEEMEKERAGIAEQLDRAEGDMRAAEAMRGTRESDVRAMLGRVAHARASSRVAKPLTGNSGRYLVVRNNDSA